MRREYTLAEIERRGLGIVNQDLVFGPVPVMQSYRPVYVLMRADHFYTLAGEQIAAQAALVKELLEDVAAGNLTPETARQALAELEAALPEATEFDPAILWYAPQLDPAPSIHQLKITLEGFKPPIWRRIQVDSDTNLRRLHDVIQVVMGWQQAHLYMFTVGRTPIGEPHENDFEEVHWAVDYTLRQVTPDLKAKLSYLYDFGDSWKHKIVVEKIIPPEEGVAYPRCVTGKRAAPLEDSGGVWGFASLLDILADEDHPEHEEMAEWAGTDSYDPEFFDLATINAALANLGPSPWEQEDEPES